MSNVAVNFFEKLVDKELHFNYNVYERTNHIHSIQKQRYKILLSLKTEEKGEGKYGRIANEKRKVKM